MKIIVIGGCNIDFICKANNTIKPSTSNVSDINMYLSGVGHNIAENLTHLGCEITLITALGKDVFANVIKDNLHKLGIWGSFVQKDKTGVYFTILLPNGKLNTGFCDLANLEHVSFWDILN